MAPLRSAAALMGVGSILVCSCGPSGGGASSKSADNLPPPPVPAAPATPSDAAPPSAAVSAAVPSAPPPRPAPPPARVAAATPAPPRQPTAAELLRDDPTYLAKARTIEALYGNARERDPTGEVDRDQAAALAELHACPDRACLDSWFRRREAALRQYVHD